jgi:hypothetical protein
MNTEKLLKKMLAPGGALYFLKQEVSEIVLEDKKYASFESLFQLLSVITKFQYHNYRKMAEIKKFYSKQDNIDIFTFFGPLHNLIKRAGMDIYKSEKHHSFVKNYYSIKKSRLSVKRSVGLTYNHIFLDTDTYDTPRRLSFVLEQVQKSDRSPLHYQMIEELEYTASNFFMETKQRMSNLIIHLEPLKH